MLNGLSLKIHLSTGSSGHEEQRALDLSMYVPSSWSGWAHEIGIALCLPTRVK